jgi:hypothetical protein
VATATKATSARGYTLSLRLKGAEKVDLPNTAAMATS